MSRSKGQFSSDKIKGSALDTPIAGLIQWEDENSPGPTMREPCNLLYLCNIVSIYVVSKVVSALFAMDTVDMANACIWKGLDGRHGCFRHFDSRSLQVFLQSRIELVQTTQFQVSHGLFLVFDITPRTDFISCGWHLINYLCASRRTVKVKL